MGGLMGVSVAMQRIYSSIQRASFHRYPVLIVGEGGAGKELVARSIHSSSHSSSSASGPGKDKPFVPLDCKALAPPLLEPELFGYAKDAFIGTPEPKEGLVRLAEDGTLLLREIAWLPLKLQAKLFHALREQEFSPVGSTERFPFRARVMATTQQNLAELVAKGAFREDLFFHLSAVRIELPPLRDRKPDIPLLASYFLEKHSEQGQPICSVSDAAMECLLAYSWPGNVLELERAIEWALSFASSAVVETDDLPPVVRVATSSKLRDPSARLSTMQPEYLAIIKALDATGGDRAAAAQLLHIDESALRSKLQSYGL
jgi:DNA-binding NtrC family response regulator